ncbi:TPA: type VI secretion system membrane subunit TssM [Proteus mirabilis]|nr:type VI secretion system membrane subunit TssM [Proteus mirabilis]
MLNSLISIITNRFLWGMIGMGAISMIIWFIGPFISIGGYRPLETPMNRSIAIIVIWAIWLLIKLIAIAWRARFSPKKSETEEPLPERSNDDAQLVERFEEATRLLKKAYANKKRARFLPNWFWYFNKQYVYQLPWYVLLGAPGSGKTTALVNSGIHFPLVDRFGKTTLQNIASTRNCDWWFAEDAVLLDTSGHYTIQKDHSNSKTHEWKSFLGLLKKYRPRQPINGVVITINLADLINRTPEECLEQARAEHKCLVELRESLKIDFPVYVMITKVDLLRGFSAHFEQYNETQRDQIWGFTFNREETKKADFSLISAYEQNFEQLLQRLNKGLADTMLNEENPHKCGDIYLFPQAFSRLRNVLGNYLNALFATSNFEKAFIPRGIYFTSGAQHQLPVMQTEDSLCATSSENEGDKKGADEDNALQNTSKNKSYFLKHVLEKVIFRESALATNNRWWVYCSTTLHWIGYLSLAVIFFTCALFLYSSYSNNKTYLNEVNNHIPAIERQSQGMELYNDQNIFLLIPYLDSLKSLAESKRFSLSTPPITYRLGLYRGDQVETASNALYQKALKNILLPYVAWQITAILQNDMGSDPDFSFEALKAYRMLYEPEYYDGKFLRAWLIFNLQRTSTPSTSKSAWRALDNHLAALLDEQVQTSPYLRDDQLKRSAQQRLNQTPISVRIYGRLKRILLKEVSLKPLSLTDLAGTQAELVFQSKSGNFSSEGIPGLYTPKGYWLAFNKRIDDITQTLLNEDGWVLEINESALSKENRKDLQKTIRLLYMQDFISVWDGFLNDIELKNISSLKERISTARIISAENSPMRNFLINVVKNVRLTEEIERKDNGITLSNTEKNTADPQPFLNSLFSNQQPGDDDESNSGDISSQPEQVVLKHYAPIIELTKSGGEKESEGIAFDSVLKQANTLYNYLLAVQTASSSGMQPPSGEIILSLQADAGRLPQPFKNMILSLANGASRDSQVKELEVLQKNVEFEVRNFCRQAIEGRYPLVRDADKEITSQDFAQMFAPNTGIMDSFFYKNLNGKVDTSRSSWRFYPGVDGSKSLFGKSNILRSFQQARVIRDTWFSGQSQKPYYTLAIRPISMDADILNIMLDLDGQVFRYSHGPLVPLIVSWPGPKNTNQIILQLNLANGKTATLMTSGDWALHRLIDKATISTHNSSLAQTATFNIEGHRVVMEFTPNSVRNPFQPVSFSCP